MYSDWLCMVTSEEYREGNLLLLDLLLKKGIKSWIADSSRLGDISEEDQLWTLQHFVPAISQTNLTKLARISGEDTGSHAKFEHFVERVKPVHIGDIQVKQFMNYKEAADWIGEIPV